jgi:hypothetical protein
MNFPDNVGSRQVEYLVAPVMPGERFDRKVLLLHFGAERAVENDRDSLSN